MNEKQLVLITSMFPHGKNETYLEAEMPILSKEFDKITILCPPSNELQRKLPENVLVVHYKIDESFNLLIIIQCFFSWQLYKELYKIITNAKVKEYFIFFKIAFNDFYRSTKFMKWMELQNLDRNALYYNYWTDFITLSLARLKKERYINKFISRFHRWDLYFEANDYPYLPFRSFIAEQANLLVFISQHGLDYIKSSHWVKGKKENLYLSRLGTTPLKSQLNQDVDINKKLIIVSVSAVIPRKRVDLIKDAIMALEEPVIWYHFGGKGDSDIFDNLNEIEQQKIVWKGNVPNEELHHWYASNHVDLFINLSLSEGVPVSIMEAMSYRIPALACNVDGNPEIVKHNYNGFLVEQFCNKKDVASLISNFSAFSDEKKSEFRENAFKTWDEFYNADKNFNVFAKTLKNI